MFYGMSSDHEFHQFIASRTSSLPIPLSFPLHEHNPSFSAAFDPCPPSSSLDIQQLHSPTTKTDYVDRKSALISDSLAPQGQRSAVLWSDDEVVALFKLRSSMEISFPDFTWGHVSRKLAEIGYKRSAEECKEKYEEGKHFNSVISYNKNCRIYNELDAFYPHDHQVTEARVSAERPCQDENRVDYQKIEHKNVDERSGNKEAKSVEESEEATIRKKKSIKKRKRKDELDMLRGYFEAIVDEVMAQQEVLHNKLIESIVKRDEENIAKEEAWKIQEMNRNKTDIEMRAKDQASAEERHAKIIEFIKKFTREDHHIPHKAQNPDNNRNNPARGEIERSTSSSSLIQVHKNPNPKANPSSISNEAPSAVHLARMTGGDAGGRRWPRDEVLALIDLRCKLNQNANSDMTKEGQKGPLWERISQGMLQMGYKRSAKRCKEKWENINKYFRKTKDGNKKRSVDSRTCPYFHQLSCLYGSGRTMADLPGEDHPDSTEFQPEV